MVDNQHRTVSVDFDGVLHQYSSGWTGYVPIDGPEPGALAFIHKLLETGYRVVVVSSRAHTDEGKTAIVVWLLEHGFPLLPVTHEKVMAVAYVDDRAIRYDTGSSAWAQVLDQVELLANRAAKTDVLPTTRTTTQGENDA